MNIKEIRKFIKDIQKEFHNSYKLIYEQNTKYIIEEESEIPLFIDFDFNYDYLKEKLFQTYIRIEYLKDIVHHEEFNEQITENIFINLFSIKFSLENLIKVNSLYSKKRFENEFSKTLSLYRNKGNYIKFGDEVSKKKLDFIKYLFDLLIKENRLQKTDRKKFINLFFEEKTNFEKINWNAPITDLKSFFDYLYDSLLIHEILNINQFMSKNFKVRNKEFNPTSYKSSKYKTNYDYDYWKPKINNIRKKLGIPQL